jgi:hypothetical protein
MASSSIALANAIQNEAFLASDLSAALSLSSATHLYLSLHSASPGTSGSQTVSEVNYTGYSRVAVARTSSDWTRDSLPVGLAPSTKNTNGISWPPCTGGTSTAKWVGIGTASSGTGNLLWRIPIGASGMTWVAAMTNLESATGVLADYVTVAPYALGATTFSNGDELAIMRNYEEALTDYHSALSELTAYYVKNGTVVGAWPEAVSFQLATVSGAGTLVDLTPGDSRCTAFQIFKLTPLSISSGVIPTLPTLGGVLYGV